MKRKVFPRRTFLKTATATTALSVFPLINIIHPMKAYGATDVLDTSTVIEENGKFTQDWFLDSFLDLSEDLVESAGDQKRFAIIWEQKGCPYCRDTHMINFSTPKIRSWIKERFNIVQLDIWGSREVTDFDGEVMEERELARKSRVTYTPSIQFFPPSLDGIAGKSGFDIEINRMPGYFRRFHFITMFEYIYEKAYEKEDFQRYLVAKAQRLQESGTEVEM